MGQALLGLNWHGRQGRARSGAARLGSAGQDWQGMSRNGEAGRGSAWRGRARHGRRGQEMNEKDIVMESELTRVCAWCGAGIDGEVPTAGPVSHGMCEACAESIRAEYGLPELRPSQTHGHACVSGGAASGPQAGAVDLSSVTHTPMGRPSAPHLEAR